MSKLLQYNGKEWIEIKGQDAVVDYDYILSQIPKPKDGINGKDGSPDTGLEIVEKINDLPTDEDKYLIDMEHIDGLLARLKELGKTVYVGGGSSSGGRIVKVYDLSSQLNGVTKTFSLPAFWHVITVQSSSFPNAFRPTIDYTTDAGASTITFTSEINETATLATGQTIIVQYAEA